MAVDVQVDGPIESEAGAVNLAPRARLGRATLDRFLHRGGAVAGLVLLVVLLALALAAPLLFPGDPMSTVADVFLPPLSTWAHPLGTDALGRDVAAGVAYGGRMSLTIGVLAAGVGVVIGVALGATAGYCGGWVDRVLMRISDLFQTTPAFLLAVVIVSLGGTSIATVVLGIGIGTFPTVARIARGEFRLLKSADFVAAARSQGYGPARIVLLEILPNALPPLMVTATILVAQAILTESGLSFLGLGDPNVVSWGSMLGAGRDVLQTAWYLAAIPGGMIVLAILSLNLIGDGLNEALNPRLED